MVDGVQYNSLAFIYVFLPLFLVIYYLGGQRYRNGILFFGSLIFYALSSSGNYWWVAILIGVTFLSYYAALSLAKAGRGWLLGMYLFCLTCFLAFFKLYQGGKYLPAGMSFYLFQIAACLIDVYRGRIFPEKSFGCYMNQIIMFPKLLSGPLMNPEKLRNQVKFCSPAVENIHEGLQKFLLGLGMKVLLANRLGGIWSQASITGYTNISTPYAWIALISWAMQLYFDFYGYSLMAIGVGKMIGFDLPKNFLDPYASKSVSEFYRRWHATLGAWFKEYLYIPLGGNRKGTIRTLFNLAVVWLFTGLWHGVGGNYLLWAAILYLLIVNERLWFGKVLNRSKVLCHIYVIVAILLSWVPFAVPNLDQMMVFFAKLFGIGSAALNPQDYTTLFPMYTGLLTSGVILATPIPGMLWKKIRHSTFGDILMFILFWAVIYYLCTSAQDPFMYFQY